MATAATASRGSGRGEGEGGHICLPLGSHLQSFSFPSAVEPPLDNSRGGFLILCLSRAPRPKDARSHHLERGRVDSRPGPRGGQPAPIPFLAPVPHLSVQAPGRARCHNTRSYWGLSRRGWHGPSLQTIPTALPIPDLCNDHM